MTPRLDNRKLRNSLVKLGWWVGGMQPKTETSRSLLELEFLRPCQFLGPEYLTVSSLGPAGEEQSSRMGVYSLTGETHNNKPLWSRHDGTATIFYTSGNFIY